MCFPAGQIVGRMNEIRPTAEIVADLVAGFEAAVDRLDEIRG
ncbi:putative 2-nitropropane dioxygenase [Mycobacteroides abscessus subsp. abscessus]|nr:putative 2-nitropropane dioxygenase [Mycobacteroides abscessus subsp. abscessus]